MSEHDRHVGAATLKRLRRSRGMSLADAARALTHVAARLGQPLDSSIASVQRTVARWESTRPILPSVRYQLLLAHLYARHPDGETALGTGSDFAELLDALRHLGEGERAVDELRRLLVRTSTDHGLDLLALIGPQARITLATALADPGRADEDLLDVLRTGVSDVNRQVGSLPFVRLQLLLAPVVESCRRLLLADAVPAPLLPGLWAVASQAYTLAGRLAFETRDDAASHSLYAAATEAAGKIGMPWRRAMVHMSHALVTLYSTPGLESARRLVDAAVRDARAGDSTIVRARAHALQAEITARAGREHAERQARAALSLAWYDLKGDSSGDPAASSFTVAHLRGFEGVTSLYVGDAAAAHDEFARSAAALIQPREQVQRAIVMSDQALARLRLGDPQSAASLLHECVDAASATGGRVATIRLQRARRELRPWRREDWVADLDDHMIDSLGA
ncbi:hypothetical protein [Streptomyces sp. N2A]|uniref:hypothetical protein n=1 Tax=Streptomyces sp. N2A TaxID=3073936 RepID=UPI002870B159|nr:hypothetical protein [Streptomyces sp. N2A]